MRNLVILFVMFFTILGPSVVIATIGFASIRALGRNPSASSKILSAMIVSLVFAEAVAIIGLLVLFHIFGTPEPQ
ncbi:MAG: ATP synthase F0 subunit C [Candidatus Omnitrophica bacterium]|nr:ATP synthase F0 subunit C [Candidatus Omnitrophota bacterium]